MKLSTSAREGVIVRGSDSQVKHGVRKAPCAPGFPLAPPWQARRERGFVKPLFSLFYARSGEAKGAGYNNRSIAMNVLESFAVGVHSNEEQEP
jgi:hypothetical protein